MTAVKDGAGMSGARRTEKPGSRARCGVCGQIAKPRMRSGGWELLECAGCGLVFVDPGVVSRNYRRQYLEDASSRSSYYIAAEVSDAHSFRKRLRLLQPYFPERGRLLDIGSSTGTLLREARAQGWRPTGIEPNACSVAHSRKRDPGIAVHSAFFDAEFAEAHTERYDLVFSSDVIEHAADPVSFLASSRRLLNPGGFVVTVTPDFDSLATRLFHIKPAEHLYYLRRRSIGPLFRKAGLDVVAVRNVGRRRDVDAMLRHTNFADRSGSWLLRPVARVLVGLRLAALCAPLLELFGEDLMIISKSREPRV